MGRFSQYMFTSSEQIDLLTDLSQLLKYGDSPQVIVDDFKRFGNATEKLIAQDIEQSMANGKNIADGLKGWIPKVPLQAIVVGEKAGELAKGCELARDSIKASTQAAKSFKKEMFQPVVLITGSCALVAVIASFVFPQLEEMMPINRWPAISQYAREVGLHFAQFKALYLSILIVFPIIIRLLLVYMTGSLRSALDELPIFKQYSLLVSCQMLLSVSQLLKANVGIDEAIRIVRETANPYLKSHLDVVVQKLTESNQGGNIGSLFNTGLLNKRVQSRIGRVNNQAIKTSTLLERAANEHGVLYEASTLKTTNYFSGIAKIIAVMIMMLVFGGVFLLVFSMASSMGV